MTNNIQVQHTKPYKYSEAELDLIKMLKPLVSSSTQFILMEADEPAFGKDPADDALNVIVNDAVSVRTTLFQTDGDKKLAAPIRFGDGSTQQVTLTNWKYVVLVNDARRGDNSIKTVITCYLRERTIYAGLRKAVGLTAF